MQKIDKIKKCNKCGKEIPLTCGASLGDGVELHVPWGYFSEKDGETHIFCLCEHCYDEMISGFSIPVTIQNRTELI